MKERKLGSDHKELLGQPEIRDRQTNKKIEKRTQLLSININGLNDQTKRKKILSKLMKQNVDIICLQEVHIRKQDKKYLEYNKLGNLFAALSEKRKRGAVVYIRKEIIAKVIYEDPKGRVLLIEVIRGESRMLLINIYALNKKQK